MVIYSRCHEIMVCLEPFVSLHASLSMPVEALKERSRGYAWQATPLRSSMGAK